MSRRTERIRADGQARPSIVEMLLLATIVLQAGSASFGEGRARYQPHAAIPVPTAPQLAWQKNEIMALIQ